MSKTITIELVSNYLADQCSPEEIIQVNEWFNSFHYFPDSLAELSPEMREALEKKLFEKITRDIHERNTALNLGDKLAPYPLIASSKYFYKSFTLKALGVAASLLMLLGVSLYIFNLRVSQRNKARVHITKIQDFAPGGNKAMLTLGNGKTIILDSAHNGLVATQGNVNISKTKSGHLAYTLNERPQNKADYTKLNIITTPTGGQYQVVLPDGTEAWLNSRSSLSFPVRFSGSERKVEMTGEVYFEVAKNTAMPFKVKSRGAEIEVLGTHFNIMAYDDELEQKTTLLEGSVRVSSTNALYMLKPGQQAAITKGGEMQIYSEVNTESVMAWKNGLFDFKNLNLAAIMRQAARWYDMDVIYKGQTAGMTFTGRIPKDVNLPDLLNMLQYTGLKYHFEGKTVTFEP